MPKRQTRPIIDDPVRRLIAHRLDELGLSMAALAKAADLNVAYVQQYLKYGKPAKLGEDERAALAAVLGLDEADLRPGGRKASPSPAVIYANPRDLPVYGRVQGGPGGEETDLEAVIDYVERPGALAGVRDAFACYVTGHSMEPALRPGYLVFVAPSRPIRPGMDVVIDLGNHRGLVKHYIRQTQETMEFQQFNPVRILRFKKSEIAGVFPIVLVQTFS